MERKKTCRGHFCWACDRIRANEKFNGDGHKNHVCRDCQKLDSEELTYRQAIRNIDQCIDFGGGIRRKQRARFQGFLSHSNPRIREYAQKVKADIDAERKAWREALREDERMFDEYWSRVVPPESEPSEFSNNDVGDLPF